MPPIATHLTTGADSAGATTYQTEVIAPTSGRLILVSVCISASASPTPSVSLSGCGLSWAKVTETADIGVNAIDLRTVHLFRARGNPTSGRITITTASAATACTWQVVEFSGVDTSGTNGSGAIAQSLQYRTPNTFPTSVSRPFGTTVSAANSAYAAVVLGSVQEAMTAGTGWTAVEQITVSGPQSSHLGMRATSGAPQNVAASWTTAGNVSLVAAEVKAATGDTAPPSVPSNVTAVANSSTQVTVSWTASTDDTGVASYRVRRNGSDLPGATAVTGTSYVDSTVVAGTPYSYTVSAVDAAGNRSAESAQASVTTSTANTVLDHWSGTTLTRRRLDKWNGTTLIEQVLNMTTDKAPPSTPTGLTATAVSSSQIDLTWTASTDDSGRVDGYRVRRNGAIVDTVTGTSFSDTGRSGSTTYTYTVQAFDDSGNYSAESAQASATTPAVTDTTPPTVPTNLAASVVSSNQINLTWTASTDNVGVARYIVLRGGTVIASNVTTTSYSATGLSASTSYTFTVQAADAAGNVSAESAAVSATTQSDGGGGGGGTPTGDYVIGLTAAQIQALPRSGTEWTNFKRQADGSYSLIYLQTQGGGDTDGSGNCVAGALMYVATGNTAYRDRVLAALRDVEATNPGSWWHAAANRKLGGWALAGHLIGHETASWHNYLRNHLTIMHEGHNRSGVMHKCAWEWDNNHGAAAQSSYAVICAILGLTGSNVSIGGTPGGIYHLNKWLRGWLGDHSTATGFGHRPVTGSTYGAMGITDPTYSNTWQDDPNNPYGVVPSTASVAGKRGAVPSDVIRDGASYPAIGGGAKHYVYGNAGRRMIAGVVLAAMGYPEIWEVGDFAFYRWRKFCADTSIGLPEGANNQGYDPLVRKLYQNKSGFTTSAFTATSATSEIIPATEWLALEPSWPVRRTSVLP